GTGWACGGGGGCAALGGGGRPAVGAGGAFGGYCGGTGGSGRSPYPTGASRVAGRWPLRRPVTSAVGEPVVGSRWWVLADGARWSVSWPRARRTWPARTTSRTSRSDRSWLAGWVRR